MARRSRDARVAARPAVARGGQETPRELVPGWLPAALYAALALFLFREFAVSKDMLFGTDTVALGYFARKFYADFVWTAQEFPMWNPFVFGGLPFVDAMHGDIFYPTTLLSFVLPVHRAMGWKLVVHVLLAGVFTYVWLRRLGLSRAAATWGGAAYMLAPVLVSLVYPGHDGKLFVTALTPLLFWATDRAVAGPALAGCAALALVVALLVFTAHTQLAYFAIWGAVLWAVYRLFRWWGLAVLFLALLALAVARAAIGGILGLLVFGIAGAAALAGAALTRPGLRTAVARFALFAAGGFLGVGVGAVQLVAPACYVGGAPRAVCGETFGYSQRVAKTTQAEEERGYAYSTSWSLHPEEAVSLVVPEFIGANLSTRSGPVETYWGRNLFKLNHEYAGALGLFLAPLLFLRRRRGTPGGEGGGGGGGGGGDAGPVAQSGFLVALAVIALVYALGATTPFFRIFYHLVPGVKLFRAPSSIMFLFALATTTLGALAIDMLGERGGDAAFARRLRTYFLALAGALLVLALLASAGDALSRLWTGTLYDGITAEKGRALSANLGEMRRGFWITLALAALTAALVWGFVRGRVKTGVMMAGLVALAVVEEVRVDARFIQTAPPAALFPADETIVALQQEQRRSDPFRVFALPPDAETNIPALYGIEQVLGHHGNEIGRYRDLVEGDRLLRNELRILKLLNARFLLSAGELRGAGLRVAARGRRWVLYELEGAFPRAFLVGRFEVVPDAIALERLLDPEFDAAASVLLSEPLAPEEEPQEDSVGSVRWLERGVNRYSLEVNTSGPGLLVIGENYYPAWKATVDGRPARVLRANYTLRAVPVPAGAHRVELFYESGLLRASLWLSLACAIFVLALLTAPRLQRAFRDRVSR